MQYILLKYCRPLIAFIARCVSVSKEIHINHIHGQNTFWHGGEEWVLPLGSLKKGRKKIENVHLISLIR